MLIPSFEMREITGVHSGFPGGWVSWRTILGQTDDAQMNCRPMPLIRLRLRDGGCGKRKTLNRRGRGERAADCAGETRAGKDRKHPWGKVELANRAWKLRH